jgi:hypothetical protein
MKNNYYDDDYVDDDYIDSNNDAGKRKTSKGLIVLLIIIVLGLAASIVILLSKMNENKQLAAEREETLEVLTAYGLSLEGELTELQGQFGAIRTHNDSLMTLASEQQERITRLLAIQADNTQRIRTFQRELETLREVLRSYIVQVDSLNQSNIALRAQTSELTRNLETERRQNERLTQTTTQLTSTVQRAQVLTASNITVTGLNNRGNATPRVRNVERLQTCFVVRENQVANASDRTIYIVIRSGNRQISNTAGNTFQTHEGEQVVYTDRRTITYENADIEVCIFTVNNGRLTEGNYTVMIYCDGFLIGSSSFDLR